MPGCQILLPETLCLTIHPQKCAFHLRIQHRVGIGDISAGLKSYICLVKVKRYSRKEPLVFVWVMLPYIIFMNILIFGGCIFQSAGVLLITFVTSIVYFFTVYGLFGSVAVFISNRYPAPGDLFRRISIMLPVFYLMNILVIYVAFTLFDEIHFLGCPVKPERMWWTILYGCIMSTVITFINEGMANWEKWKSSLAESEKLRNAYQRSKLLGLKGQINPHFLFNCFNALSGLIQEDSQAAEKFLDEMTRVHRYLLRSEDGYLVRLADEISFARSYMRLIKGRFGEAIQFTIDLPAGLLSERKLPPLSMQVVLENIIYTNALSKSDPMKIVISSDASGQRLLIQHSLHEKIIVQHLNLDEGLDNLVTRYNLLGPESIRIVETPETRTIELPLFNHQTEMA